jgi:hypothetical protein
MLLYIALALSGLGFFAFVAGQVLDMAGVAVIGAVIVVGVGAMVTGTGLEYRDGERVDKEFGGENNSTVVGETVVPTYTQLDTPQHLSLGMLWLLLGGTLTLRGINRAGE